MKELRYTLQIVNLDNINNIDTAYIVYEYIFVTTVEDYITAFWTYANFNLVNIPGLLSITIQGLVT